MIKGSKHKLETRRKISESQKGEKSHRFGKHCSDEHKRIISKTHKGKIVSLETRLKRSKATSGKKHYFFGKHHTPERIKKTSGENCHMWKGGISFEPYGLEFNRQLREQIKVRDGYRCQECFRHETELFTKTGKPRKLACHHIDYNKLNNNPSNLLSLCIPCHAKTNFKRKHWIKYFEKMLALRTGCELRKDNKKKRD